MSQPGIGHSIDPVTENDQVNGVSDLDDSVTRDQAFEYDSSDRDSDQDAIYEDQTTGPSSVPSLDPSMFFCLIKTCV